MSKKILLDVDLETFQHLSIEAKDQKRTVTNLLTVILNCMFTNCEIIDIKEVYNKYKTINKEV